jgi:hypothetical protein
LNNPYDNHLNYVHFAENYDKLNPHHFCKIVNHSHIKQ